MAEEQRFTPGPWWADDRWITTTQDDMVIAVVYDVDRELNASTARLIAAAPEMYEALKRAISQVEDDWHEVDNEEIPYCGICDVYLDERHTCFIGEWQAILAQIDGRES